MNENNASIITDGQQAYGDGSKNKSVDTTTQQWNINSSYSCSGTGVVVGAVVVMLVTTEVVMLDIIVVTEVVVVRFQLQPITEIADLGIVLDTFVT